MINKTWELVNFCEFDSYAVKSYCAIHNENESKNLGDITKVDETKLKPFNMICGGSPCQDFSVAGKQKGSVWTCKNCGHEYNPLTVHWSERDKCPCCESSNIDKTRSSLLVEYLRVIRANKPNFGMYENVKNIVGKQFKDTFKMFTDELEEYGYNVYWKVLNAKDYGIPQNRERVYLIFIKKELDNGKFTYPEPFDNGMRLKDILEENVDEKFYISEDKVQRFLTNLNNKDALLYDACQVKREGKSREYNDFCPTLTARDYKDPRLVNDNKVKQLGNIVSTGNWDNPQRGRIYSSNGCSPALNCCGGGGLEPKIVQLENTKNPESIDNVTIRKLTPKECFRLMGFSDDNFKAAEKMVSNSQLYKQAGNSIVVDVLYYILVELYKAMPYLFEDLRLSSFFSGIGAFEIALNRLYKGINSGNFTNPQAD